MKLKIQIMITIVLLMTGLVLLALSIFGSDAGSPAAWYLPAALACITAANVINIIRIRKIQKSKGENNHADH